MLVGSAEARAAEGITGTAALASPIIGFVENPMEDGMLDSASALRIEERGDGFALCRTDASGAVIEMTLSAEDVLALAQSIPLWRDRIAERQLPAKASFHPVSGTVVAQLRLAEDPHRSEIHLGMMDRHGTEVTFFLPLPLARSLADRLPDRVADLERAQRDATKQ